MDINGFCHDGVTQRTTPKLSYDETKDFSAWKAEVKEKLIYETPCVNLMASSVQDVLSASDLYSDDMEWEDFEL